MQAIYDAIDGELELVTAGGNLTPVVLALTSLIGTLTNGQGAYIVSDTREAQKTLQRVKRLNSAFAADGELSFNDALAEQMGEIVGTAADRVRSAAPNRTGLLANSGIRSEVLRDRRRIVARVLAHARGKQRYNYAWFTEVGTQKHNVDALGYVHTGTRHGGKHKGIPEQRWFQTSVDEVFSGVEDIVADTMERIVMTYLTK